MTTAPLGGRQVSFIANLGYFPFANLIKWFELVGLEVSPPPDYVLLAEGTRIITFRNAVFHDIRHALPANVFPFDFKVYANKAVYNSADRQALPDGMAIGALGGSKENALVVERMRWERTMELDPDALSLPFVDGDSQLQTWQLDATAIDGFGIVCRSDKLVLFRRPDAIRLFNFLRDDVLRDGRCGYVLGPDGSGKTATAAAFALALARTRWVVTWIHLGCMAPADAVRLRETRRNSLYGYSLPRWR